MIDAFVMSCVFAFWRYCSPRDVMMMRTCADTDHGVESVMHVLLYLLGLEELLYVVSEEDYACVRMCVHALVSTAARQRLL